MSSAALVQAHPALYLGPLIMGPLFQAIMQGLIIQMSRSYFSRAKADHPLLKGIIAFLNALAFFQTCGAVYDVWTIFVVGYGNWVASNGFTWPQKIQPLVQATMTAPVQGYYIWRCWKVTKQNWRIILPLASILVTSWACALDLTRRLFQTNFALLAAEVANAPPTANGAPPPFPVPVDPVFITWLVSAAVLDVAITSILLTYLLASKSQSAFNGLNDVIGQLIFVLWETAIPPCTCGLTVCVAYLLLFKSSNNIVLFFEQIMGKLYVISLLVTFTSRLTLNVERARQSYEMSPWSAHVKSEVRVEITTTTKEETHSPVKVDKSLGPEFATETAPPTGYKIDYDRRYDEEALRAA
ncbi:hypothetical protein BOTBODRAFT_183476 [Botryobasidium botryosum FD-172 SS1]|uniref:DUF6534 domain-containing protein n=1 Tax=Botryobasidium botryosum (strain FD-172 SS1) TaxID=930990 RepID=A0A067NAD4_BOTB1|nr:hypothetical protein BOTBODRAFT_183476 [Botryobasidium botryosum FD-172 SS1]